MKLRNKWQPVCYCDVVTLPMHCNKTNITSFLQNIKYLHMKFNRLLTIAITLMASVSIASAVTFSVNGLYYRTTSSTEVEVAPSPDGVYQSINDVAIPPTVENGGITYQVTAVADGAFAGSQVYTLTISPTLRRIGSRSFMNTSLSMARLQAPGDAELVIADSAFMNCRSLYFVGLPARVVSIGNAAFWNCNLESLTLPKGLKHIGQGAFAQNYEMESVDFEAGGAELPELGNGIFANCVALNSVTFPEGISMLPSRTFFNAGFTQFTIPSTLETIGSQCFASCRQLTEVNCEPDNNLSVVFQDSAFAECPLLRRFDMPENTKSIGNYAFYSNSSIVDFDIKAKVETIGEHAFEQCSSLLNLSIWTVNPPLMAPTAFYGLFSRIRIYVQEALFRQLAGVEALKAYYPSNFNLLVHDDFQYNTLCVRTELNPSFVNVAGFKAYKVKNIDKQQGRVVVEQVRYLYGDKRLEGDCIIYRVTAPDRTARCDRYQFTSPFTPDAYLHGINKATEKIYQPDDQSVTYYTMSRSTAKWRKVPDTGVYLNLTQAYLCADIERSQAPDELTTQFIDVRLDGDMNGDGILNVTDLGILVNMLLGVEPMNAALADVDGDGRVNSSDVSFMVTLLLGTKIKPGDVNLDGQVNVSDVTALVNMLLGLAPSSKFGDVDENGSINVSDVTMLVNMLLG